MSDFAGPDLFEFLEFPKALRLFPSKTIALGLFSKIKFDECRLAARFCYTAHNQVQQVICHLQMDRAGRMPEAIK